MYMVMGIEMVVRQPVLKIPYKLCLDLFSRSPAFFFCKTEPGSRVFLKGRIEDPVTVAEASEMPYVIRQGFP